MAKENPQASDENELEIGFEESEEERSDSSSSEEEEEEEEEESDVDSSDSESESGTETVTGLKRPIEEEEEGTSVVGSKKSRVDGGEEDWFEGFIVKAVTSFGVVNESAVRERWSMVPMETKKRLEEEWRALEAEQLRIVCLKAKLLSELASALAKVF